ncbi:hypothetical protein [Cellulosimicrobium cellulans]|uniref:hypothetical protein n=1 Tax=Cellulosimicrobium cellulans TaxID=1710 RepID=UPI00240698C5|nr:hypothetical protein [Cellulosimicrobium cellulans]MDF9877046.1 DNA-binding transcriptional ArsR family regulator [Cellulosimicrobium cellulans]
MNTTTNAAAIATPAQTREGLLKRQARGYTQVRGVLVQRPQAGPAGERASLLARFVSMRRHRALVLYLLLLGAWPEIEHRINNGRAPLEAQVWVRALTSGQRRALTWSSSALSRTWGELEDMQLVTRDRQGRLVHARPRREDGLEDYTRPQGRRGHEHTYFVLPDAFWNDEVFAELGLAALAMFLLIAKETNGRAEVHLTHQQFQDWYGIRQRTAQKGIAELKDKGFLHVRPEPRPSALSGSGFTVDMHYSLIGNYGYQARAALRKRARSERAKRLKPDPTTRKKLRRAAARTSGTAKTPKSTKTTKAAKASTKITTRRATTARPGHGERERA